MGLQPDSSVILTAVDSFNWTIFSIIYTQHSNDCKKFKTKNNKNRTSSKYWTYFFEDNDVLLASQRVHEWPQSYWIQRIRQCLWVLSCSIQISTAEKSVKPLRQQKVFASWLVEIVRELCGHFWRQKKKKNYKYFGLNILFRLCSDFWDVCDFMKIMIEDQSQDKKLAFTTLFPKKMGWGHVKHSVTHIWEFYVS